MSMRSVYSDGSAASARKLEGSSLHLAGRRIAIAASEPEDAHMTGMTRSLDRRLLALNLKPMQSAGVRLNRVA